MLAFRPKAIKLVDLAATLLVLPWMVTSIIARGILQRLTRGRRGQATRDPQRRALLLIQTMHTHATIAAAGHEEIVFQAGLEGYFEHVFTLYPTLGADSGQPRSEFEGRSRATPMNDSNTFIEYKMTSFGLGPLQMLDFVLSQSIMLHEMVSFLREREISVIRANCPLLTGLYAMVLAWTAGIPYTLRIGSNYDLLYKNSGRIEYRRIFRTYSIAKRVLNLVLRNADAVCAVSENNLSFALNNGARPERCTVVRYGNVVDNIHFAPREQRVPILESFGVTQQPVAVCVGRLASFKYPEDVVRATMVACRRVPNLLTLFVGEGDMQPELEQLAAELGISSNIRFLGKLDQKSLARVYGEVDIYLSPLTGRCLVEAALAGIPLIAYDYEWHSEFVLQDRTGLLVPYRDAKALGEALAELLLNPSRARKLGVGAREHALEKMDKDHLLQLERESYQQLLSH